MEITFGDYLRAIITADYDLNPDDFYGYRLAFVESFRQWGIHPTGMRSMSIEGLLWPTGEEAWIVREHMRSLFESDRAVDDLAQSERPQRRFAKKTGRFSWDLESDRYKTWEAKTGARSMAPAIGLVLENGDAPPTVFRSKHTGEPAAEVHSVRSAARRTQRGAIVTDIPTAILRTTTRAISARRALSRATESSTACGSS